MPNKRKPLAMLGGGSGRKARRSSEIPSQRSLRPLDLERRVASESTETLYEELARRPAPCSAASIRCDPRLENECGRLKLACGIHQVVVILSNDGVVHRPLVLVDGLRASQCGRRERSIRQRGSSRVSDAAKRDNDNGNCEQPQMLVSIHTNSIDDKPNRRNNGRDGSTRWGNARATRPAETGRDETTAVEAL